MITPRLVNHKAYPRPSSYQKDACFYRRDTWRNQLAAPTRKLWGGWENDSTHRNKAEDNSLKMCSVWVKPLFQHMQPGNYRLRGIWVSVCMYTFSMQGHVWMCVCVCVRVSLCAYVCMEVWLCPVLAHPCIHLCLQVFIIWVYMFAPLKTIL